MLPLVGRLNMSCPGAPPTPFGTQHLGEDGHFARVCLLLWGAGELKGGARECVPNTSTQSAGIVSMTRVMNMCATHVAARGQLSVCTVQWTLKTGAFAKQVQ